MSHGTLMRVAVGLLLIGGAVAAVFFFRERSTAPVAWERVVVTSGHPTAPVTLYFGHPNGWRLMAESREVVRDDTLQAYIGRLVEELLRGSFESNRALFTDATHVRAVFLQEDGDLSIDFDGSPFPADATAATCYLGVVSLLEVVSEVAPEVRTVTLLANGAPLSGLERRLDVSDRLPVRAMVDAFAVESARAGG